MEKAVGVKPNVRRREGPIFHGWWIVLVSAVGMFTGYPPIIVYSFGVFLKAFSQTFDWSRAEISFAFSLAAIGAIICSPFVGRLVDRFGARRVVVFSALAFGLLLCSLYFQTARIWRLYATYFAIGAVGTGTTPVPYSTVISRWFDRRRGLALGLAMTGGGLGAFAMPSLSQFMIARAGWRVTYPFIGLLVLAVTLLIIRPFLKETPEHLGLTPDGVGAEPVVTSGHINGSMGLSGREAFRTRTFWMLVCAFFFVSASVQGCLIHLVPMLTDRGMSTGTAAFAASLLGGAVLLGRAGAGYLLDRYHAPRVTVFMFVGAALGLLIFMSGVGGGLNLVAASLVGLGLGAETDILPYLVSRYFGLGAFGEIYGYMFTIFPLGGAVGPLLMGAGFDKTGSYFPVLLVFLAMTLIASLIMMRLGQRGYGNLRRDG